MILLFETEKIIKQFLSESNDVSEDNLRNFSYLMRQEIYDTEDDLGKRIFDFSAEEFLCMISKFQVKGKPILNMDAVSIVKMVFGQFFDWCVENKYAQYNLIKKHNEEKGEESILSIDSIIKYLVKVNGESLVLYSEKDIEKICKKINLIEGGIYYEGIIRSFYEGIDSTIDFVNMKQDDIDWDNNTISFGYKKIKISNRLKQIYKDVGEMNDILIWRDTKKRNGDIKTKTYSLERFENSLYKFPTYGAKKWDGENSMYNIARGVNSNRFKYIEKKIGYKLNSDILYHSYILKNLLKYCNGNMDEVSNLILGKDRTCYTDILNKALSEMQCKYTIYKLRAILKPYFIKF